MPLSIIFCQWVERECSQLTIDMFSPILVYECVGRKCPQTTIVTFLPIQSLTVMSGSTSWLA